VAHVRDYGAKGKYTKRQDARGLQQAVCGARIEEHSAEKPVAIDFKMREYLLQEFLKSSAK
jgi:hypothetical protein